MCRLKAFHFTQKIREIGGFDFNNVPRAPHLEPPDLPNMVPLIYHGNSRSRLYCGPAVALPLYRLLHRMTGAPKFTSEVELRERFRLGPNTTIILSGIDQDQPLERWWRYGREARVSAILALRRLGVSLVTTPNYSLFANRPRWDDLHSMKRIALVNDEFLQAGMPSALHVNARSDTDNERWIDFVAERPEITHLAYEFTTGSGRLGRCEVHAGWLARLAHSIDRPLTIVIRGGLEMLPVLVEAFDKVVVLDTSAFMRAVNRRNAIIDENAAISWEHIPTPPEEGVDDAFEHNVNLMTELIRLLSVSVISGK
ncbi:hypothetical protein [Inquilinus sp. CA228]|uniref:hypothetical protein n=1 Tax=Inquilinus sp. CA228 TaxID=3455609 RepID=UPI003F8CFF4B